MDDNYDRRCSIHDISDDILAQIFQIYVALCDFDPPGPGYYLRLTSYKARITLCSINHRMRILAIAMSELWADIQIGPIRGNPPIPLLELCVKRFGTVIPILVDCYGETGFNDRTAHVKAIDEQHIIRAIDLLFPHVHRWKSFKIFFTNGTAQFFANISWESATSLETIDAITFCDHKINDKVFARIAELPALRRLKWTDHYILSEVWTSPQPFCSISNFSWNRLQHLNLITSLSPDMLFRLLSSLTSAVTISIDLWTGAQPSSSHMDSAPPPLLCLPKLRDANISADINIYSIFQHLDLPGIEKLKVLSVVSIHDEGTISFVGYRDFIVRASASLNNGIFGFSGFHEDDILELFSHPDVFRIPAARFHRWGDRRNGHESAARVLKFLEDKSPGLQPYLRDWSGASPPDIGWDRGVVESP